MRKLLTVTAVLAAGVLPGVAHADPLSPAQARWFTERAVHPWRPHAVYGTCKRLSPTTLACPVRVRLANPLGTSGPRTRLVELVELGTEQHITVTLAARQGIGPGAA